MSNEKATGGLTAKHKVGYAMGDLGGCMTFALMGTMVTRYYTNVLQINTVVLAALLLVWNVTPELRAQIAEFKGGQNV